MTRFNTSSSVIASVRSDNTAITTPIPILEFCSDDDTRDGVFYYLEFARGLTLTEKSVRKVSQDRLDALIKRREAAQLGLWREHLLTSVKLLAAFQNEDEEYFRRLIRDQPELVEDPELQRQALARPQAWLASYFASGLEGASFVVWWDERQKVLAPGILCKKHRATPYALAAAFLQQPKGIGICLRCNTPFKRKRSQQSWCSTRCRCAEAMARLRQGGTQHRTKEIRSRKTKRAGNRER